MKLIIISLLLASCASKEPKENGPKCYFFEANPVVQISSDESRLYLFSQFQDQEFFYYEQRDFVENFYFPVKCKEAIVKRAQYLMEHEDE